MLPPSHSEEHSHLRTAALAPNNTTLTVSAAAGPAGTAARAAAYDVGWCLGTLRFQRTFAGPSLKLLYLKALLHAHASAANISMCNCRSIEASPCQD